MEKINFKNGQAPALNATNLNQLQTNIENAINSVVESGSNNNGSWIKYSDGTMICRKSIPFTDVAINNSWDQFFISSDIECGKFAQEFVETPNISRDLKYTTGMCMLMQSSYTPVDYDNAGAVVLVRGSSLTISGAISIIAIGKWK